MGHIVVERQLHLRLKGLIALFVYVPDCFSFSSFFTLILALVEIYV